MLRNKLIFVALFVFVSASEDAQDSDGENFCDKHCPDYFRKCPAVTTDQCSKNWFAIRCPRACGTCTPCDWAQQLDLEAMGSSLNEFQEETEELFNEMLQKLEDTIDDVLDNNEIIGDLLEEIEKISEKFQCSSDDECNGHGSCSDSSCSCDAGYTGDFCSNDVDECASGDACTDSSQICENNLGSYECACEDGYFTGGDGTCQESALLNGDAAKALASFLPDGMKLGERCFSLEEEGQGYYPNYFHYYCDNSGPTVTIISATESGWIFGGYTDISWSSANSYRYSSENSFLFSLYPVEEKLPSASGNYWELYDHQSYGPTFGGGHNLYCGSAGSLWGYTNTWTYAYAAPADTSYNVCGVSKSSSSWGYFTYSNFEVYLVE